MLHTNYQGARYSRFRQDDLFMFSQYKSKAEGKTQKSIQSSTSTARDTIWESEHHTQESQEISHFQTGDHMSM